MKEERAPLTDQELEEIRGRLDEYGRAKAARVPLGSEGIDENLRFMAACDDLCNHAPADIASLLEEVERLKGVLREIISECQPVKLDLGNTSIPRIARAALEGK